MHIIGSGAELAGIHYFSALAKHLEATKPDVTRRHQAFISCLEATGVTVSLSRFKRKSTRCNVCGARLERHEEKETDVAIASTLFELFHLAACDTAVILSGDTDLAPAVRTVQRVFRGARVHFAFPYGRKSKELAQLAPGSFQMTSPTRSWHRTVM
ncbi:MAG: NYN domain-containing protein [Gemmatimonadota bacterium]